jgi:hypothetical protein
MDVLMPQLGETVSEGKILSWFKSVGDKLADLVTRLGIDERTEGNPVFEPVTNLQRLHALGKLSRELVMDRGMDVEAIGGRAGFSHVAHLGDHRTLDRGIDVGIIEDDKGGVAAQLHDGTDDVVGCGME